jgi:hypothetical protein
MKKMPISWEAICILQKGNYLKSVDVALNKKGIAFFIRLLKKLEKKQKYFGD